MTESQKHGTIRNLIIFAVVALLCIALLEAVSGFLLANPSLAAKQKILDTILSRSSRLPLQINYFADSKHSPHPYLLYQNTPGYRKRQADEEGGYIDDHDSLGYRSDEFSPDKPEGVFRVLALGGSTTYGVAVSRYQEAWPHLLQNILNTKPPAGYERVEVINGGMSGATSAEILSGWVFRYQYLNPDLVILNVGGNDIGPLMYPDYHPEYTHYRARGVSYIVPLQELVASLVDKSATLRLLSLAFLPEGNLFPVYISQPYPYAELDADETYQRVTETYPLGFARNVATLVESVTDSGSRIAIVSFMLASQEWIVDNSASMAPFARSLAAGLEQNRAAMSEIAERYNLPYLVPEQSRFPDPMFVDHCHLRAEGQLVKAEVIASFLESSGLIASGAQDSH